MRNVTVSKIASILRRRHCFPLEMTSEEQARKCHTDDSNYPDLGSSSN